ncbi:MAG: HAD family hydrolase [Spirochaetota bacterium]
MRRARGVCFDLDGLLVNTEGMHVDAYQDVASHLGVTLSEAYLNSFLGAPTRENLRRIMADHRVPPARFDELLQLRYRSYESIAASTPHVLMPGARECLEQVRARGLRTALVTSSIRRHALAVLENLEDRLGDGSRVADCFDHLVFGDQVERCKPAPDLYLEALRRLRLEPEETVALEDSEAGVTAARAAGLYVVAVPCRNTNGQDLTGADVLLSSLGEVCSLDIL